MGKFGGQWKTPERSWNFLPKQGAKAAIRNEYQIVSTTQFAIAFQILSLQKPSHHESN